jgi:hypothetical protein
MINSKTKPILVVSAIRSTANQIAINHFASGDGRFGTIPYCRNGQMVNGRRRTLDELDTFARGYVLVSDGSLMNCEKCAALVARYPTWRPNHFPLMLPDLRWI